MRSSAIDFELAQRTSEGVCEASRRVWKWVCGCEGRERVRSVRAVVVGLETWRIKARDRMARENMVG